MTVQELAAQLSLQQAQRVDRELLKMICAGQRAWRLAVIDGTFSCEVSFQHLAPGDPVPQLRCVVYSLADMVAPTAT